MTFLQYWLYYFIKVSLARHFFQNIKKGGGTMTLENEIVLLFVIDLITIVISVFGLKMVIKIFCSEEDCDDTSELKSEGE